LKIFVGGLQVNNLLFASIQLLLSVAVSSERVRPGILQSALQARRLITETHSILTQLVAQGIAHVCELAQEIPVLRFELVLLVGDSVEVGLEVRYTRSTILFTIMSLSIGAALIVIL
jgi:hypothetical protein